MKSKLLCGLFLVGLYVAAVNLFPPVTVDAANNGFLVLPASPVANRVPVSNSTTPGDVTWKQVPNAALANSSVTVNGSTCTLGGSCAPSGGISGPLYSQIASVSNSANSAATSMIDATGALGTVSIASAILNTAGNVLHVYGSGTVSTAGSPGSLAIRVRLASTNVCTGTVTLPGGLSVISWSMNLYITSRIPGSSGTLMCNAVVILPSLSVAANMDSLNDGGGTFNTTGAQTFDFTTQWNGFAAGDAFVLTNLVLAQI